MLYFLTVTVGNKDYAGTFKVKKSEAGQGKGREKLLELLDKYSEYKTSFAKQIKFDPKPPNLSK